MAKKGSKGQKKFYSLDDQNIVAIIPARGGSKGIPKKNIVKFCDKPLLSWTVEQSIASRYIKNTYVSSDDKEILRLSESLGATGIKRPKNISNDTSSTEEALFHALSFIEKTTGKKIDIVVFLQVTSPLRDFSDIDNALEYFVKKKADSLFSAAVLEDYTIWEVKNGVPASLTFDYKLRGRRQDRDPLYLENGSIYVFRPEVLKKFNNRLGGNIAIYEMDYWKSYEIDKLEDLEVCEYYMKNKILKNKLVFKGVELIAYDFDGVFTDNKVYLKSNGAESVIVNRSDGLAVDLLRKKGLRQMIITTETNEVVALRAKKLNMPLLRGVNNKKEALLDYCRQNNISPKKVIYIGNDLNDFEVMKSVGYPVCPLDACGEIKAVSKIVLNTKGGGGVARELINYIK